MTIRIQGVSKRFAAFVALDNVTLDIPGGSLTALLGPSGSGKTTLLRILAGLEVPDQGRVHIEDDDITDVPARDRGAGFVFQHYALFRHMTVFDNVAFGLKIRHRPSEAIRERVCELLQLVGLAGLEKRYPSQLSGGQRQRVALARALAVEPRILLLDEPFGALDARVRQELRGWLRRLHDELRVTSVFVTHDQDEAFEVADRVVILQQGQVEQIGSPAEVWDQPASRFVLDFLGNVNHFQGWVESGRAAFGGLEFAYPSYASTQPIPASIYVRPHDIDLDRQSGNGRVAATVRQLVFAGSVVRVHLDAPPVAQTIQAEIPRSRQRGLALTVGDQVYLTPKAAHVFLASGTESPTTTEDYSI